VEEAYDRLRHAARQSGIRGSFGGRGGGGMPPPRGFGMGLGALALLGGAAFLAQNGLFNVDGGHRAIKYRRMSGVSKEIYNEGK
jgi:prohibitin 2